MSLRHVVCFRFQPDVPAERVTALAEALRGLPAEIPEIASYHVGTDLGLNPTSWDFAVSADFATEDDYATYRDHPRHQAIIAELVLPIVAERASVQFTT
jgi:hypothetical protein